jgi:hypothetical protein
MCGTSLSGQESSVQALISLVDMSCSHLNVASRREIDAQ